MTWILAFVFILGAAVVLHEFGHFLVAKMLGIRVETFSVGFGKRIWGRRWGTTDYRVSLIPLGGYVKLGGDESNAGLEEGANEEIPAGERFDLRPRWQKIAVAVAGPVMNVLTALAIPLVLAMIVGVPLMPPPVVGDVIDGSAAEAAGLRPGDRIVSFNGREGGTLPAALNAANEEAVAAFLAGRIRLTDIPRVIGSVMDKHEKRAVESLDVVREVDSRSRLEAAREIAGIAEGSRAIA